MITYMVFDYETFSECDIKNGGHEYATHPSTEVLCVAYRIGTWETLKSEETRILTPMDWGSKSLDTDFVRMLLDPAVKLVAHNAFFELLITKYALKKITNLLGVHKVDIDPKRWICTAAMARTAGLPGKLELATAGLELEHLKDTEGHRIMLKLSKPQKVPGTSIKKRLIDKALSARLYQYCIADIAAEVDLLYALPMLTDKEAKFWRLDLIINQRGFLIDRELVKGALYCLKREAEEYDKETKKITVGKLNSTRQGKFLLPYLKERGVKIKDLKAASVAKAIEGGTGDLTARRLLEIRSLAPRSSTSKYPRIEARSRLDGRARDNTIFFGAHTGRQSGTGLQPQNLFKSVLKKEELEGAIDLIRMKDVTAIRALFDNPVTAIASAMRGTIIAPEEHVLDVCDFATIEVRVMFWVSQHVEGLNAIRSGRDLYLEMASIIYNVNLAELTLAFKAGEEHAIYKRQLGKQVVLGAQFGIGIGGTAFQRSAKGYGIDISLSLAQTSIRSYRKLHAPVVKYWSAIEAAAIKAVQNPGKRFRQGYLIWEVIGRWLTVELPIGRRLYYYDPKMIWEENNWGAMDLKLSYMGYHSQSKKFIRMSTWGGKLTENVVQGIARDVMYEGLLRLERRGHKPILAVHDEAICERSLWNTEVGAGDMKKVMEVVPKWAEGLPIKSEGWSEVRYRK